jgi:transcriptional regulator with XRE-family HTH domain
VNPGAELRAARRAGGLTQAQLAERTSTSQATISAYESGAKQPSVDTLSRLLAATGARLAVVRDAPVVREPTRAELAGAGEVLVQVLDLAGELPVRHDAEMHFPALPVPEAVR